MTVRRTWWVKLRRARKHLVEFQAEFDRLRQEKRPYSITPNIETDHDGRRWLMVHAALPSVDVDDVAAILGDVIFNARSALDHICVALTGNDDAQFPIFTQDVLQPNPDPATGKDRNKARKHRFNAWTKGMPVPALRIVKASQPYAKHPNRPEFDPLAIFNRLSNADKHRTLFDLSLFLYEARTVYYPPNGVSPVTWQYPKEGKGIDGAVVGVFPLSAPDPDPQVESTGGIEIGLKEAVIGPGDIILPGSLENLIGYIEDSIIQPLDALIA